MPIKITTMTWPSAEAQANPAIDAVRIPYIRSQVDAGTTDGVPTVVSPTVTSRRWIDQASADAWSTFIQQAAVDNGTTVSVVITDETT